MLSVIVKENEVFKTYTIAIWNLGDTMMLKGCRVENIYTSGCSERSNTPDTPMSDILSAKPHSDTSCVETVVSRKGTEIKCAIDGAAYNWHSTLIYKRRLHVIRRDPSSARVRSNASWPGKSGIVWWVCKPPLAWCWMMIKLGMRPRM